MPRRPRYERRRSNPLPWVLVAALSITSVFLVYKILDGSSKKEPAESGKSTALAAPAEDPAPIKAQDQQTAALIKSEAARWTDPLRWMQDPMDRKPDTKDSAAAVTWGKWMEAYYNASNAKISLMVATKAVERASGPQKMRVMMEDKIHGAASRYITWAKTAEAHRERYERYLRTGK